MSNKSNNSEKIFKAFRSAYVKIAQSFFDDAREELQEIERKAKSFSFLALTAFLDHQRQNTAAKLKSNTLAKIMLGNAGVYSRFRHFSEVLAEEVSFTKIFEDVHVEIDNLLSVLAEARPGTEILGKVYENLLPVKLHIVRNKISLKSEKTGRKSIGAYYTPTKIVKHILGKTLGKILDEIHAPEELLSIKMLDPAAGCGQFLLGAIEFVRDKYKGALDEKKLTEFMREFAEKSLYAVDVDRDAVEFCRIAIWLETDCKDFSSYVCANSLVMPDFKGKSKFIKKHNLISWRKQFPEIFNAETPGFDVVLGNPPYISFSGRHAEKISAEMLDHFHANFNRKGWLTTQSMFLELAIKHLSKRFTSFIVPAQIAQLAGYAQLRELMEHESELSDIKNWGEKIFENACTPSITFVAEKKNQKNEVQSSKIIWQTSAGSEFLLRITKDCFYLDKLVADPGVHTGNCAKKLIKSSKNEGVNLVPVLEGKQILRYQCLKPVKYLDLSYAKEEGEYFAIRPLQKYSDAKFIIRQTASFPVVAPRMGAEYFRNSALALYSPKDEYDVRYLVGILNSKFMRCVYREIIAEAQQKAFPQVKVNSLRKLPMKQINFSNKASKKLHDDICVCVENIMNADSEAQFSRLDKQINTHVYKLYGLKPAEIKRIEESN